MKKILFFALLAGVLVGNTKAQTVEMNKKSALAMYDALARHDFDKFMSYIAEDGIDYAQGPVPVKGKAAIAASLKDFFNAFPGYTVEVHGIAADGNKIYVQNTFKGTQKGMLGGMIPATGKSVVWSDVDIIEFNQDGKTSAHWANNPNAVLDQIGFHALTNPNTANVMQGYALFGKGDAVGILAACTDDIVWNVSDSPAPTVARVYKGKAEVGTFFKNLKAGLQITKFEPYRYLADGDDVIAFVNSEYKLPGNSKLYKANLIHHFTMRDGKIASFKEFIDKPQEVIVAKK